MRFKYTQKPGLLGLTHIWEETSEHGMPATEPPFQIRADEGGVRLTGDSTRITDQEGLQSFARATSDAWQKHFALKRKVTNAAGH